MLELQREHQARVRIRTRKRVEDAIAAEVYTAAGTAPRTTRHFLVSRADVHRDGAVHGGRVMRWIDEAANACAASWTGVPGLTSYVAAICFRRAVAVGDRLEVSARIVHTGPRSVHIGVRATTSDMVTGVVHIAAEGLVVVASLDEHGRARHVPQWAPGSDEDIRLDRHARHLLELRRFFEPYPASTGFPLPLVGSGASSERSFEEREL
jgi:4-hydroxybenzoyl-CoA thioesterase